MLITDEVFKAFLECETKSFLKSSGVQGEQRELIQWQQTLLEDYKEECCLRLRSNFREDECLVCTALPQPLKHNNYRLVIDCLAQAQGLQSHIHALEFPASSGKRKRDDYIPIRFVPSEKITKYHKLLLGFDALVLDAGSGKIPPFGKIIHGSERTATKVYLAGLIEPTKAIVSKIAAQSASQTPPDLILNKHCVECEFKTRCHEIAVEKDDLSLLTGMSEKERAKQRNKGIFSVNQLSYTFRPRRRPKRLAAKPDKYSHALKALAIREKKIHIAGNLKLTINRNPVYLDVEGVPDQDFYYLIGLRLKSGDRYVQHSFWANDVSEGKEIWASCLRTLASIENPQLVFYGSYETTFLKRMKARYGEVAENASFVDQLIKESLNILSVIYAQIYFPTYSNGLKEIANYLGFQWSASSASGIDSIMWRSQWESSKDSVLKHKLLTYNSEDCEALERIVDTVAQLCQRQTNVANSSDKDIVHTDALKPEFPSHFRTNSFTMPELEYINQAAYWDYQREKVYVRSNKQLKRLSRKRTKGRAQSLPVNTVVECPPPTCCPKCQATRIVKHANASRIIYDLKFSRTGVKRWIVKYTFCVYLCNQCGAVFRPQKPPWIGSKVGGNLLAYLIYQTIELLLPQVAAVRNTNQLFEFHLSRNAGNVQKSRAAQFYKGTYKEILKKIVNGRLIHADETKISIRNKNAFVWVLANLEEVVYLYTETREGDFLQELLQDFTGVLVSDFYAAYDSIDCPQQKCLIHLIRDLNDDLLGQPFNEELKELVREFSMLLKPMIETVDRFGLKAHFLRKHKVFVERFYRQLSKRNYRSEIAIKYKARFEKNRDKLFTFLDYDGVPWNNNNAEHAVKAFAALRKGIDGLTTDAGIRDYVTLLSICETCKCKGVSFLDFLRSRETDIDAFIMKTKS